MILKMCAAKISNLIGSILNIRRMTDFGKSVGFGIGHIPNAS